jgi:hypothetical protein
MSLGKAILICSLALGISGCSSWGRIEDYKWEISLNTPSVSRGGDLIFHVDATKDDGTKVRGIPCVWIVDWASVKGSRHRGETGYEFHLRCKGDHGKGELRIYVANENNSLIEVARGGFVIE